MTISLCMIVKNEEAVLARALDSAKEIADEIIIVDTGSTDRTREIARRYTDRIFDFPWRDDFAAARNASFSYAACDLILWLDADDVIPPSETAGFLALKQSFPAHANALMLPYRMMPEGAETPTLTFFRERIVRRSAGPRWVGRVHEVISVPGDVAWGGAAVWHKSGKRTYTDRNLRIYRAMAEAGEPLSLRDRFYFGRELYYHGLYEEAIGHLCAVRDAPEAWLENRIEACRVLALCEGARGNTQGALTALLTTLLWDAPRAEVACDVGNRLLDDGQVRAAVFWFETALRSEQNEERGGFVDPDAYGYTPCIQLCVCYDRLGDIRRAERYNRRAGEYHPDAPAYRYNLAYFAGLRGGSAGT